MSVKGVPRKPEWSNAPEWAFFLAQDKNGKWFWFENDPTLDEAEGVWRPNFGRNEPAFHWTETSEARRM